MTLLDEIGRLIARKTLVKELAPAKIKQRRLRVCEGCDSLNEKHRRCKICKCYVDEKAGALKNWNPKKRRNEITHCPRGKWGDINITNEYRKIDGLEPLTNPD